MRYPKKIYEVCSPTDFPTQTHTHVAVVVSHTNTSLATLLINQSAVRGRIGWDTTQNTYSLHKKISFLKEHEKSVLSHPSHQDNKLNRLISSYRNNIVTTILSHMSLLQGAYLGNSHLGHFTREALLLKCSNII